MRVASYPLRTTGRVTSRQHGDHSGGQFRSLYNGIRSRFSKESVHVFNTIMKLTLAPIDIHKEQLILQTSRDKQGNATVARGYVVMYGELPPDLRLDGGLPRNQ